MRSRRKEIKIKRSIKRALIVFLITILLLLSLVLGILFVIEKGPSKTARDTFVSTVLESGKLKFLARVFLTEDEVNAILESASLGEIEKQQNTDLINTDDFVEGNFDENGIEIIKINRANFLATLMVVKDPSTIKVSAEIGKYGTTLDKLVEKKAAIGGVNGGLFYNSPGYSVRPYGATVSDGEILDVFSDDNFNDYYYMVGFDDKNILRIVDVYHWKKDQYVKYINDEKIRDAVCFEDVKLSGNYLFCPLIINGEPRVLNGVGSGQNPRSAIGQRADGAVLILVTDGRWANGHPGATAADLINIFLQYGAINAANLDGGYSSALYYNGEYIMGSAELGSEGTSIAIPNAFVVMKGE